MNEQRQYNSLLQLTRQTATQGEYPFRTMMDMQYNFPTGANNGKISSSNDWLNGETVNYTYDSLNRLSEANLPGTFDDVYSYDGFGNLTSASYTGIGGAADPATNRLMGISYDASGNPTGDVYTQNVWDVENRMVKQIAGGYGGNAYVYDPSGRRVLKNWNSDPTGALGGDGFTNGSLGGSTTSSYEFYFYGITGQKMATLKCQYYYESGPYPFCWVGGTSVYFAGQLLQQNGAVLVRDRVGSVRADSNGGSFKYYPYGGERTSTSDNRDKFGMYFRDGAGQDYAEQRYYNAGKGRFWNVDPGGIATATRGNPGSWNRYGYVFGDPVNLTDRHGMNVDDNTDTISCYWDEDSEWMTCNVDAGGGGYTSGGDGAGDDDDQGGVDPSATTSPIVGPVFTVNSLPACPNGQSLVGLPGSAQCTALTITSTLPVTLPNIPLDPTAPIAIPDPVPVVETIAGTISDVLSGIPGLIVGFFTFAKPATGRDEMCWEQYQKDLEVCRALKSAACYDQASQRYAACLRGRSGSDLPPLPFRKP